MTEEEFFANMAATEHSLLNGSSKVSCNEGDGHILLFAATWSVFGLCQILALVCILVILIKVRKMKNLPKKFMPGIGRSADDNVS